MYEDAEKNYLLAIEYQEEFSADHYYSLALLYESDYLKNYEMAEKYYLIVIKY